MSNLDNLTSKILADSEREAEAILYEAKTAAQKVIDEHIALAEAESERIRAEAEVEAIRVGEQIILSKTIAARDENLAAKQESIDGVFKEVLKRLNEMPEDKFFEFAGSRLAGMKLEGYEIILPKKFEKSLNKLNKHLAGKGCEGKLVLAAGGREIFGGFILKKGGIEINNTFESLVNHYRFELETDVLKMLY